MHKPVSRSSLMVAAAVSVTCALGCGEHFVAGPVPTATATASLTVTPLPSISPRIPPPAEANTGVFTCNVAIAADASGDLDYTFSGVIFSDPNGGRTEDAGDQDGRICIAGSTPCAARRTAPSGPALWIPDQDLSAGTTTAAISVRLVNRGVWISGIQSDIAFPSAAPIAARASGKPDCTVNPDIDKGGTSFAFRPAGCTGADCTAVRALVAATDNTGAIDAPGGVEGAGCNLGLQCSSGNCLDGLCCAAAACPAGEFCNIPGAAGHCQPPQESGEVCSFDNQCQSGSCVDNACCTVPACGAGQSCNVFGHAGVCTAQPSPTPTLTRAPTRVPTAATRALLRVNAVAADAGNRVSVEVVLDDAGIAVAATQNDLSFDRVNVAIAARSDGQPDCTVEPTLGKGATSFAFLPPGCTGMGCTSVRALVVAADNVEPIADGSVLYRCNVDIAAAAPDGVYPIAIGNIVVSDPEGRRVQASGIAGQVLVGAGSPLIALDGGDPATPGTRAQISAVLHSDGTLVAGSQNDIVFDPQVTIAAKANGRPDCEVNPAIGKDATSFAFRPPGCIGAQCRSIRVLVLSTENTDPIADGSLLYSCVVDVAVDAAGSHPLSINGVILSTPQGERLPGAAGLDGVIVVLAPAT